MTRRQKDVRRHLTPEELNEAIDKAQQADEARLVRRLMYMKTLYSGDTLAEAAQRAGINPITVGRWIDRWNEDGIDGLRLSFGDGNPPKLPEQKQEQLKRVLAEHQP